MDSEFLREGFLGQKLIAFPEAIIDIVKSNPITEKFYISDLGYYPEAHNHYRFRENGANEFVFIYCIKGKGDITINNSTTEIAPNQLFIIPKNVKHEYRADKIDPWSIYWFHFNGTMAPELYKRYQATNYINYIDLPFSTDKIDLFNKIFDLFERNYLENHIEYANLLSLGFISSFVYHDSDSRTETDQKDTLVDQIKNFLLSNLGDNFTLVNIADKFNYSKSYLHTKFKRETGYSIMVFFNLKKIQKACEYLNYTDMSIKEISYKVGFDDPLYFSRIFKNFMGKSPRHYKQSKRK
ncbi:AraC family transcriptional regulator [Hyunsoonleella flava]|uniref:AraC family transcriptional regulator n=1 Tax=Hyunsoonleella flava TaxID=2527939 RepID=A0A4Q9FIL3_9FLAO|nr:AraC family transcriptional regulator [Hyunsoonleella flava]TBN06871.1 AraC family transcriptional regulator [Hyunsoonleella flava]